MMAKSYFVERELKFKTVPNRWETLNVYRTRQEAEEVVEMFTKLIDGGHAKGGGEVVGYRVKESG
jgi:hypothetical protein